MQIEQPSVAPAIKRSWALLAVGAVALVGAVCLLNGSLQQPAVMGSVQVARAATELEQQAAAEVGDMLEKARLIMQDPEKVKLLAKRIQAAFASQAFVAKMRTEMAALRHDETFYEWLRSTLAPAQEVQARRLGAAFQVQPLPPSFRGMPAPKALAPRVHAGVVMDTTLNVQDAPAPAQESAFNTVEYMKQMPGVGFGPFGYFDPLNLADSLSNSYQPMTEGKALFMREVELKHCRVAMLAAVGFPIGEQFHPLFGGDIDTPSFVAFQASPLEQFWPTVVAAIAIPEIFSVFSFQEPGEHPWEIKVDHKSGDFGFDPLGLKPTDPEELKIMQTKELNNGRLAMLAIAGMVVQEGITGAKLF